MKLAFSWDDGAIEDQKLFELHEKYEIPGMFFIPTKNREGRPVLNPEQIKNSESRIISFGGHTANHTYLTEISLAEVSQEVKDNKEYLEDILGHEVNHFCFPGGKYNEDILNIVYQYYNTTRTADTMNFKYNGGALKPAIHFFPRGHKSLIGNAKRSNSYRELIHILAHMRKSYFELINSLIELESKKDDSVVMIWGHSWEIEKHGLWKELEKLFITVKANYNYCKYDDMFDRGEVDK